MNKQTNHVNPAGLADTNAEDLSMIKKVHRILDQGKNAEVKRTKDGKMVVYEVNKTII